MTLARHHGGSVIVLTFLMALLLTIVPLPEWLRYLRPDWVGLARDLCNHSVKNMGSYLFFQ